MLLLIVINSLPEYSRTIHSNIFVGTWNLNGRVRVIWKFIGRTHTLILRCSRPRNLSYLGYFLARVIILRIIS